MCCARWRVGWLGILGAIIEVPMLAVLHPRQQLALRCAIAFQLIDDEQTVEHTVTLWLMISPENR
jgi:hypothetical protein